MRESDKRLVVVDPEGDVAISLLLEVSVYGPVVIEENGAGSLAAAVRHAAGLLD